jgi:hypothetical protein
MAMKEILNLMKLITAGLFVVTLCLTGFLCGTASASPFYDYKVVAITGQAGLTGIGDSPSINDHGDVAFVGVLAAGLGQGVFKGNGVGDPINISGFTGALRVYGRAVQINNNGKIVARDQFPGSPPSNFIRLWDANQLNTSDIIASGGPAANDYDAVFAFPAVNNNNQVVFSALGRHLTLAPSVCKEAECLVTPTGNPIPAFEFNEVVLPSPLRPMIVDDGRIIVRAGNLPTSPIRLYSNDLSSFITIAETPTNFTALGGSPGVSDDGSIVVFYGDLTMAGAKSFNTTPGPGIFASIETGTGRVTQRIAGVAGNGFLDPGETFDDINPNGTYDAGEPDKGPFASFDPDSRVGVNSTHRDEPFIDVNKNGIKDPNESFTDANNNGRFDPGQHAVTIVYMAFDSLGRRGLYTNRLNFFNTSVGGVTFTVSIPTLVVKQGETIPGVPGAVQTMQISDPLNNRDRGDIAFWISTTFGSQAIIRARPQEVVFLDFDPFDPLTPYTGSVEPVAKALFADLGLTVGGWFGSMASFFSNLKPSRVDLLNTNALQNDIVDLVQDFFNDVDPTTSGNQAVRVKVIGRVGEQVPTDGPFMHVFIGDQLLQLHKCFRPPQELLREISLIKINHGVIIRRWINASFASLKKHL